jgi:hypothetical protein
MYKLGMIDLEGLGENAPDALEAVFALRNFSGGVFWPVMVEDTVYYRGTFSAWDALLRYPETGLTGLRVPLSLLPWTPAERAVAGLSGAGLAGPGTGGESAGPIQAPDMESRRYFPFSYLNPFKLWLPLPLVRMTGNGASLDGGGLFSFMSDPTDTNLLFLFAYMDARSLMAATNLQWINLSLGFPLNISFSDDIDKTQPVSYRKTRGTISGALSFGLGNERRRLELNPGLGFSLTAPDSGDSAYTWEYGEPYYNAMLGVGVSNLRRFNWELFGQGAALKVYNRLLLNRPGIPRFEGILQAAFEPYLPLKLSLYGAWDENGMDLYGNSKYYDTAAFGSVASVEYSSKGLSDLRWLGGGEAELRLFSLDFQKSLSHLYINRFFGTLAYRGVLYDDQGIPEAEGTFLGDGRRLGQSLVFRLGATASTILVTALPVRVSVWVWGAWKISNSNDGKSNDFVIGPGFSVVY